MNYVVPGTLGANTSESVENYSLQLKDGDW